MYRNPTGGLPQASAIKASGANERTPLACTELNPNGSRHPFGCPSFWHESPNANVYRNPPGGLPQASAIKASGANERTPLACTEFNPNGSRHPFGCPSFWHESPSANVYRNPARRIAASERNQSERCERTNPARVYRVQPRFARKSLTIRKKSVIIETDNLERRENLSKMSQ